MAFRPYTRLQELVLSPDGSNHALYPGFAAEYVLRARRFKPREYLLEPFDAPATIVRPALVPSREAAAPDSR